LLLDDLVSLDPDLFGMVNVELDDQSSQVCFCSPVTQCVDQINFSLVNSKCVRLIDCGYGYAFNHTNSLRNQCIDIDECASPTSCADGTTCVNTEGSFFCKSESQESTLLKGAQIGGIVTGSFVAVLILIAILLVVRKRQQRAPKANESSLNTNEALPNTANEVGIWLSLLDL
jgi:hypothetical protein